MDRREGVGTIMERRRKVSPACTSHTGRGLRGVMFASRVLPRGIFVIGAQCRLLSRSRPAA